MKRSGARSSSSSSSRPSRSVATTASRAYWARPLAGTVERTLVVGGVTRTYLLHAGGDAKPGRPLVLVLHGLGGNGAGLERRTRGTFDKLADQFGAVVVYPQASGERPHWGAWRVGAPGAPPPPDDLGFLSALIDTLAGELAIDRKRVFAAGFSNGASMVYRLACERPELVAAIAPVSGGMFPDIPPVCRQGAPVSIIGMHGTADPIVPSRRFDSRRHRRVGHARRLSGETGHVPAARHRSRRWHPDPRRRLRAVRGRDRGGVLHDRRRWARLARRGRRPPGLPSPRQHAPRLRRGRRDLGLLPAAPEALSPGARLRSSASTRASRGSG